MRTSVACTTAAVAFVAAIACARAADGVPHAIDPVKSKVAFSVAHIFVERVTGTIPIAGGTLVIAPDTVIPTSLSAELAAANVKSGDGDRDASLQSPDFFDAKEFPTWTFVSTKITPLNATSFGVDGTLTIRGTPQPQHLDVSVHGDALHPLYHAVGHVDRKAFHMPITRLDPVIGATVDITLDVVTK
jgi:polyisoprenoid-binding protein YceI